MAEGNPIIPRSKTNPVGQVQRILRANMITKRQLREVKKWLVALVRDIPFTIITTNKYWIFNVQRYEYQISVPQLASATRRILDRMTLEGNNQGIVNQSLGAYQDGTGQSVTNLANISDDYTRTVTSVLSTAPYQRRVALVSSRVFEEMAGFDAATAKDLSRVLSRAIEDGVSPRAIVGELSERFSVAQSRAARISRTEITGALRRARWDEAADAQEKLSITLRLMHLSALSPTTRESHSARHGGLYTVQDTREFYAVDANGINCKCSQTEVLVNPDGSPKTPGVVDKTRANRP